MRIIPFFTTENQLVKSLKKGEARAQKIVYDRYSTRMLAICVRYVSNQADAEEVMIDGFMRIYDKVEQFREEGSFEGWMRRIMVTESLMFLRRTKSLRQEVSIDEVTGDADCSWNDDTIDADSLLRLISQLPDGYRTVFNLYAIEGYTHTEIAGMLGITEGTSKSQLSRARTILQVGVKKLDQQYAVTNYGKTAN